MLYSCKQSQIWINKREQKNKITASILNRVLTKEQYSTQNAVFKISGIDSVFSLDNLVTYKGLSDAVRNIIEVTSLKIEAIWKKNYSVVSVFDP